jgi:hypothetical protein
MTSPIDRDNFAHVICPACQDHVKVGKCKCGAITVDKVGVTIHDFSKMPRTITIKAVYDEEDNHEGD